MQDNQNALQIPATVTTFPCEECGKSPALQYAIAGIASGVLCRECLDAVIADVNNALAKKTYRIGDMVHLLNTPYNARIVAIIPNFEDSNEEGYSLAMPETAIAKGDNPIETVTARLIEPAKTTQERIDSIADSIVRLGGKEPCSIPECSSTGTYQCFTCERFFCYGHILFYQGLHYCSEHLPEYDKHQQF